MFKPLACIEAFLELTLWDAGVGHGSAREHFVCKHTKRPSESERNASKQAILRTVFVKLHCVWFSCVRYISTELTISIYVFTGSTRTFLGNESELNRVWFEL